MPETDTANPRPLTAAGWLAIVGAAIGIFGGMILAGVLSATGLTSANLPPLPTNQDFSTPTPIAQPSPTPSASSSVPQPTLTSAKSQVAPGERFDLTGAIPGLKDGTTLQVQAKDGSGPWTDFPVTPTAGDDGSFSTEVYTTRTGTRSFRVIDKSSGKATPVLKMQIG